MPLHSRSNYEKLPNGALDPVWFWDGKEGGARHAVSPDRIGKTTVTIPEGTFAVQRHILKTGDRPQVGGGHPRCEVLNQTYKLFAGDRGQFGFGLILPVGFKSTGSGWNSLCDLHYPNNGPAQSPFTLSVRNAIELWISLKFGPLTSDGTMGSQRVEKKIATLTHGKRHTIAVDLKQSGSSDGLCVIYVDGADVFTHNGATISNGKPSDVYLKVGFYCSASDQAAAGDRHMDFTNAFFYKGAAEADKLLADLGSPATGPGPDPTPDPDPTPTPTPGPTITANSSIKAGRELPAGKQQWMVSLIGGKAKGVEFFLDGKSLVRKEKPGGSDVFEIELDLTGHAPVATIGFTVTLLDGSKGPSFPAYPVIVKAGATPPPPSTKLNLRKDGESATSVTVRYDKVAGATGYQSWKNGKLAGKAGPDKLTIKFGQMPWSKNKLKVKALPDGPEETLVLRGKWVVDSD